MFTSRETLYEEYDDFEETDDSTVSILTDELSKFPVLLDKSQLSSTKEKKQKAMKELQENVFTQCGKKIEHKAILKMISNIKTRLKKKTDLKATGNMPIKLSAAERKLWDLLNGAKNPVFQRLGGKKQLKNMFHAVCNNFFIRRRIIDWN
jgi:hypothetical protein